MLVRTIKKKGVLDLVDLAGSERLRISKAKGTRLEECRHINQSLSALSKVISSLSENPKRKHISYRDSKLTRLLKESLGGNSKTCLIACISPSHECISETLSTLHFACKAKLVRNKIEENFEIRKIENSKKNEKNFNSELKNISPKKNIHHNFPIENIQNLNNNQNLLEMVSILKDKLTKTENEKESALKKLENYKLDFKDKIITDNEEEFEEKMKLWTEKSKEELIGEILQYRKLVKNQRKTLESLSSKISTTSQSKIILNLKEQIKFYKAKSKVLEKKLEPDHDISNLIYSEIQNQLKESNSLQ